MTSPHYNVRGNVKSSVSAVQNMTSANNGSFLAEVLCEVACKWQWAIFCNMEIVIYSPNLHNNSFFWKKKQWGPNIIGARWLFFAATTYLCSAEES